MKIMDVVRELQGLNYELSLQGDYLRFRYTLLDEPPTRAVVLLKEVREHKAEILDYLRLLQTPQKQLERPLLIESQILGDRLYLCADEDQARDVEAGGGLCYLPQEIQTLLANSAGMDEGDLKEYS